MEQFRGTTIVAVKKDGKTVIAGDGQVTMGQQVILKGTAHKVRRLFDGKLLSALLVALPMLLLCAKNLKKC